MVGSHSRQRSWIARQDFLANRRQAFAKDLAYIRMFPRLPHNLRDGVGMDVSNRELVEIGREAAAGLDLAFGIDDEGLAGAFAIILLEPDAVPGAGQLFRALYRSQVIPVQ